MDRILRGKKAKAGEARGRRRANNPYSSHVRWDGCMEQHWGNRLYAGESDRALPGCSLRRDATTVDEARRFAIGEFAPSRSLSARWEAVSFLSALRKPREQRLV